MVAEYGAVIYRFECICYWPLVEYYIYGSIKIQVDRNKILLYQYFVFEGENVAARKTAQVFARIRPRKVLFLSSQPRTARLHRSPLTHTVYTIK